MNRREFIEQAYKVGAGLVIGGSLLDLSSVKTIAAKSRYVANDIREIPINLTDNPDLKPVGGSYHLEIDDMNLDILVAHVTEGQYVAVDMKCTHKGCDVNYQADQKNFLCPCHGSTFDLTGAPTKGPATKPLNYYHAELKGNEVMVTVYGPGDKIPTSCIPIKDSTTTTMVPLDSLKHTMPPDSLGK